MEHMKSSAEKTDGILNENVIDTIRSDVYIASTTKLNPEQNSTSDTKEPSSSHPDSKHVSQSTSPSLVASLATPSREDEYSLTQNGSSESWDKQSESSAAAERSGQMAVSGKDSSGDDDWINVPALKAEKELRAAPLPAVNIWQQRKEALEAKARANVALRSSIANTASAKVKPPVQPIRHTEAPGHDDETKKRTSSKPTEKGDGISKKKAVDDTKARDEGKCSLHPYMICMLS